MFRFDKPSFALLLSACMVVGLGLRLVVVFAYQGPGGVIAINGDGADYHWLAANIADGVGFVSAFGGESGRPPAWPLTLAAVTELNGENSLQLHQTVAALIGTVTVGLVGLAGRSVGGSRVGIVAAAIAAVYPGMWIYEWPLLSETLLLPLVALMIWAAYSFHRRPSWRGAITLGVLCGLVTLTRSEQMLVGLFVVAPLVLLARTVPLARRLAWLATAAAIALLMLVPWAVHNANRFDKPVVLSTGLGNTLLAGNCDTTYKGPLLGSHDARCNLAFTLPPDTDHSEADGLRRDQAVDNMSENLGRLPIVVVAREGRVFGFFRPGQTATLWTSWSNAPGWAVDVWVYGSLPLALAATYGALELRRRKVIVYPLLAFIAITAVAVGTTIGEIRYRAGLEVPVIILAAVGVEGLRRWRQGPSPSAASTVRAPRQNEPALADA